MCENQLIYHSSQLPMVLNTLQENVSLKSFQLGSISGNSEVSWAMCGLKHSPKTMFPFSDKCKPSLR